MCLVEAISAIIEDGDQGLVLCIRNKASVMLERKVAVD
jgi:hypothetical protein